MEDENSVQTAAKAAAANIANRNALNVQHGSDLLLNPSMIKAFYDGAAGSLGADGI